MFKWTIILLVVFVLVSVNGHGRLQLPPHRSYVGKIHPDSGVPINWSDKGLNCGGRYEQHSLNGGRCGTCGDSFSGERKNELGGLYGVGYIPPESVFEEGKIMQVIVEITANHQGFFEFRICPATDNQTPVTQECLDQHLLPIVGHGTRYMLASSTMGDIPLDLELPDNFSCSHCVLQWHWPAGNNPGEEQETFRNCADIAILPRSGGVTQTTSGPIIMTSTFPSGHTIMPTTPPATHAKCGSGETSVCLWSGPYVKMLNQTELNHLCVELWESPHMDHLMLSPFCDCHCEGGILQCPGVPRTWEDIPNADPWCEEYCGVCPTIHCRC